MSEYAKLDNLKHRRWLSRGLAGVAAAVLMSATLWTTGPFDGLIGKAKRSRSDGSASSSSTAHSASNPSSSKDGVPGRTPRTLRLVATEPGRNASEGRARLGVGGSSTQTYLVGALLANGARLVEVHAGYVVLERQGQRQWLSVGASDIGGDVVAVSAPEVLPTRRAPSREPITETIRMTPVYQGNELRGYRVFPGARAEAFAALGLHPGDVITALNGAPLNDSEKATALFRNLTTHAALVATVERESRLTSVNLDGSILKKGDGPI